MNLSHVVTKEEERTLKKKFDEAVVKSLRGGDLDSPAATAVSRKMKDATWGGKKVSDIMKDIRETVYASLEKTKYESHEPMKTFYRTMDIH